MNIQAIVIAVAAALALPASAQPKRWPKEPQRVLGVTLGEPLPSALIPNCHGTDLPPEDRLPFCSPDPQGRGDGTLIEGLQVAPFSAGTILRHATDVVYGLELIGESADYQQARAVLIERYGQPTSREVVTLQNGFGAKFKGERLSWAGRNVMLILEEFAGTKDSFLARFLHPRAAEQRAVGNAKKIKESASKL